MGISFEMPSNYGGSAFTRVYGTVSGYNDPTPITTRSILNQVFGTQFSGVNTLDANFTNVNNSQFGIRGDLDFPTTLSLGSQADNNLLDNNVLALSGRLDRIILNGGKNNRISIDTSAPVSSIDWNGQNNNLGIASNAIGADTQINIAGQDHEIKAAIGENAALQGNWNIGSSNSQFELGSPVLQDGDAESIARITLQAGDNVSGNHIGHLNLGAGFGGDILDLAAHGAGQQATRNEVSISNAHRDDIVKLDSDTSFTLNQNGQVIATDASTQDTVTFTTYIQDMKVQVGNEVKTLSQIRTELAPTPTPAPAPAPAPTPEPAPAPAPTPTPAPTPSQSGHSSGRPRTERNDSFARFLFSSLFNNLSGNRYQSQIFNPRAQQNNRLNFITQLLFSKIFS